MSQPLSSSLEHDLPALHGNHLYLHIPYCQAKCPYCDFNSIAGRENEFDHYVAALSKEIATLPTGPYQTIFLGGGTPTTLTPHQLSKLLGNLRQHITLSDDYEFTCEANPGTVDASRFATLAEYGVNRISIGVQAVQAHHLQFLGRIHDAAQAHEAIALAKRYVPRVSADLMIGLPQQTPDEVIESLQLYRQHQLDHASVYHLMIEPGTEFHAQWRKGTLHEMDQDDSAAILHLAWQWLQNEGLIAYETSNFARSGACCRHNLAYWTGRNYYAAGAGAVSLIDGVRQRRRPHPQQYISAIEQGGDAVCEVEQLSASERLTEVWMLGLRLQRGVAIADLNRHHDSQERWRDTALALEQQGLLKRSASHLALTAAGRLVQDYVIVQLIPEA